MEKLRVGIIGTGGISNFHMAGYKILREKGEVEIVAGCDIDEEKVKRYIKKYDIPRYYTDCREMMEKEDLDIVSVCTWNAAHKDCTITALRGGANVICEKPMAMNAAEAEEMARVAKEEGKLLQIGFVRRFGNDAEIVSKFRDNGDLGDIYYAKATYLRRDGCPGGWFGDKKFSGGGPLIDLGVHVIDLVRYLAGNPKPVAAFGVTYDNIGCSRAEGGGVAWDKPEGDDYEFTVEDFASAMIKFDSGLTLSVEASFNLNIKQDVGNIEIFGTKAGVNLNPDIELYTDMAGQYVNVRPAGETALSFDGLFEREIFGFVNAVRGIEPCRAPAEDGVALMKILDAIYESAKVGHSVEIK
ncbi:MAG: Gfo/Idh/MocA family oxidoreductase [Clostridia bacterium]|nr:Gfo/Idh/MocA family oxidoreductase [Clostridia bacterium]